jgi:hypothetical protein
MVVRSRVAAASLSARFRLQRAGERDRATIITGTEKGSPRSAFLPEFSEKIARALDSAGQLPVKMRAAPA